MQDSIYTPISIVIPAKDEAASLAVLLPEVAEACGGVFDYEVIIVDDGSQDGTALLVTRLQQTYNWLRHVEHSISLGKSAAIHTGVLQAKHRLICTMDADGQNPPFEIVRLCEPLLNDQTSALGLICGQRKGRRDTASKRIASRLANFIRSRLLKDHTWDTGCGLKAFRRDAYMSMPYFNNMHRYLPALFLREGWDIQHVDVIDRPRKFGNSHYSNFQRFCVGIVDILGVYWLIRRAKNDPINRS